MKTKAERLQDMLQEQRNWIAQCGGDLAGYLRKYGSKWAANHSGDGGEAIYEADVGELNRIAELCSRNPLPEKQEFAVRVTESRTRTVHIRAHSNEGAADEVRNLLKPSTDGPYSVTACLNNGDCTSTLPVTQVKVEPL